MSIQKWYKITLLTLYTDILLLLFPIFLEIFQTYRKFGRTVYHILIYASPKSTNYYILPDLIYYIGVGFSDWSIRKSQIPWILHLQIFQACITSEEKITLPYIISVSLSHPQKLKLVYNYLYYYLINSPYTKFPICPKSVLYSCLSLSWMGREIQNPIAIMHCLYWHSSLLPFALE